MSERKQNQFGFYYDDCDCLECQYVRGRINIAAEEPRFFGYTLAEVTDMARDHATVHYALQCLAKDYDLAPKAESKNDAPREMTADDLALDPLTAYDMLSPQDLEKLPSSVLQHLSMLDTDVAYAFWLGAEAA